MRAVLLALLLVLAASATPAAAQQRQGPATPAQDDPLLAEPGRCRGDADPAAHHRTQRLAMHCLVRALRREAGRPRLASNAKLRHSAIYKARRIAACRVFTHTPCGDELAVPFEEAQLNRSGDWLIGENLAWGVDEEATPRAILAKWLASPSHRRVLLTGRFSHLGLRRRRLRMRGAPAGSVIWVAHLGRRASG